MALILAIEPDRRQADALTTLICGRVGAELVLADTTEHALVAIGLRVPDLVLIPTLMSPQEDAALAGALRVIATAARVQMLTIPLLASGAPPPAQRGLLARMRRGRAQSSARAGCEPAVFADQIAAYLSAAAVERRELAAEIEVAPDIEVPPMIDEVSEIEAAPVIEAAPLIERASEIEDAIEVAFVSAPFDTVLAAPPIAEPVKAQVDAAIALAMTIAIDEAFGPLGEPLIDVPVPNYSPMAGAGAGATEMALHIAAEEKDVRSAREEPIAVAAIDTASIAAVTIAEPANASSLVEPRPVELPSVVEPPRVKVSTPPVAATPVDEPPVYELSLDDVSPLMPSTHARRTSIDAIIAPLVDELVVARAVAQKPMVEERQAGSEWVALIESLRLDLARLPGSRAARVAATPGTPRDVRITPDVPTAIPLPVQGGAPVRPTRRLAPPKPPRRAAPRPIQDEWDLFDPEQCGFPALLAKLEEIASANEHPAVRGGEDAFDPHCLREA